MQLKLHNTLTKTKELFVPINPEQVGIYSCGPTVYGAPHIGNMRKYFIDDLLKNTIKYIVGLPTKHVVNITDVGHLTSDEDQGEDKMEKGARKEGLTARDVAQKYEQRFVDDCAWLKLDPWDVMPRATDNIPEQIQMVQELETGGYTYIIPGDGVYMDTSKVNDYGVLVGQKHLDGLQAGARVDDDGKRNPTDFALWKFNMTGKQRDMERDSPWGIGFPGWHIECSAMSIKYLGTHFDIHTGGIDHIPVHHTNEIAQSQCSCASTPWVNYRLHYQFLNINGDKISKSKGGVIELKDIAERGYCAEDLRMFYLQAHYRSFQDFTWDSLEAAKRFRINLKKKIQLSLLHLKPIAIGSSDEKSLKRLELDLHYLFHYYNDIKNDFDPDGRNKENKSYTLEQALDQHINNRLADNSKTYSLFGININFNGTNKNPINGAGYYMLNLISTLYDDLNTPQLLATLGEFENNGDPKSLLILKWLDDKILKLGLFEAEEIIEIPSQIQSLADQRRQAKLDKDYAKADELRSQLSHGGWNMLDGKDGYELVKD